MTVENANRNKNKSEAANDNIGYDDLLSTAGELGVYQWILFFSTAPFFAFGTFVYFSQLFLTEVSPNHWCRIPELENLTDFQRRDLGIPKDPNSRYGYSQCEMYAVNWTDVLATGQQPNQALSTVPCQYGWEFNKSEIPYPTIGSDLEWVCERNSYQATAQSIFFIGSICGGLLFGWIADRFGRLPAIMSSCLVGCVGGTTSAFARSLFQFAAARFVMGMAYDNCMIIAYLLLLEYIAPKYRTMVSNMAFAIFYTIFVVLLPWIALACGHWQTFALVTGLPFALGIFTKFILPESPRWLLSQGRVEEAIEKVLVIGRINKKEVPKKMIEQFKSSIGNNKKEEKQNWSELFRRPAVRKMFLLVCLEYMICAIIFDGLVRSIGQLEFDFFLSFSLISLTEFPSVVLVAFLMDHIGRRWMCIIFMGITCISCFLIVFSSGILSVIFAIITRFVLNMAFSAAIQWPAEVLPTSIRGSGVAFIHICGYLSGFCSPYIAYLKVYVYWLPLTVFGAIAAVGVIIPFTLPETAMKDMPQSFEDAEELTKNQKIWSMPFLESRKKRKRQLGVANESFELEA